MVDLPRSEESGPGELGLLERCVSKGMDFFCFDVLPVKTMIDNQSCAV